MNVACFKTLFVFYQAGEKNKPCVNQLTIINRDTYMLSIDVFLKIWQIKT